MAGAALIPLLLRKAAASPTVAAWQIDSGLAVMSSAAVLA
jgi:hypothetical protein